MSCGTRLDRLLNLLNSGTTESTRFAAAEQIGEIQKYHPYDLQKLLLRVYEYLRNEKWETRIAAGQAIAAIVSNVPKWEPEYDPNKKLEGETVATNTGSLKFENIDFSSVLKYGTTLLGSGGSEYEELDDSMDVKQKLEYQKAQLEKRMGVGKFLNYDDMIDDKDFIKVKSKKNIPESTFEEEEAKRKQADIAKILQNSDSMSARERNKLKRKAKEIAKQNEQKRKLNVSSGGLRDSVNFGDNIKKEFKNVVTEQPQKADKIVIEAIADTNAMLNNEKIWPFHVICALLLNDLFDPCWEIRHGAIVGLREILKVHSAGAGRTADVPLKEQDEQNNNWIEDCCIRFLCIFALDRFGDYVSGDQVVVPVRETCAQAFGALSSKMSRDIFLNAFNIILFFQNYDKWEVRHGSLLALKYLIAIRIDLIDDILPKAIGSILTGLSDTVDDVRSVASDALLPVVTYLPKLCKNELPKLLLILWDILLDLDDLTASTNSIMNLLAKLYSMNETVLSTKGILETKNTTKQILNIENPLVNLIPRLWPFLSHNISSVRKATLTTLIKLFSIDSESNINNWINPIIASGLRFIFQTIILETETDIINIAIKLWKLFIDQIEIATTANIVEELIGIWLQLITTPLNQSLPNTLLLIPEYHIDDFNSFEIGKKRSRDNEFSSSSNLDTKKHLGNSGTISSLSDNTSTTQLQSICTSKMRENGCNALGYLFSCIPFDKLPQTYSLLYNYLQTNVGCFRITVGIILESIGYNNNKKQNNFNLPQVILEKIESCISEPIIYAELLPLQNKIIEDYNVLKSSMITFGAPKQVFQDDISKIDKNMAFYTATVQFNQFMEQLKGRINSSVEGQLKARQQQLLYSIENIKNIENQITVSVTSIMSCILIAWNQLPIKLNPIIKSLMNGIKKEQDELLRKRFGYAIANLLKLVVIRTPCPNSKIITNICNSLYYNQDKNNENNKNNELAKKGSKSCLQSIANVFQDKIIDELPKLKEILLNINSLNNNNIFNNEINENIIIQTLQVFIILLPVISENIYPFFMNIFPNLFIILESNISKIRTIVAKTIGIYCKVNTLECMKLILSNLLPYLNHSENDNSRLGAAEAIQYIIENLDMNIIPYLVFLIVPILGRMSDQNINVRKIITRSFAILVRLMPLESGFSDPIGFTNEMKEKKLKERRFIEQLLDGSKLDQYNLPIPVNAQLRKYQQEGLNWLGFLQKYQLHGILCDDMGLGKTLQTLCIVISDLYIRKEKFKKTNNQDCINLPSMVVCPPTVVGHWFHEILKFFKDYAKPVKYTGTPYERSNLRNSLSDYDIIILSYDILRNDIDFLSKINWNYCVLDEGHIIRNAKTKITKAAKLVRANHRLILSGTPIQNNVLELWSLFDFLMPGFLGTSHQFNQLYGKPILASRDPKCSQKDQERGILALESLHRQVLPFLLRRVKEDVLQDLPPKIIQDYYCELSDLQKQLYEDFSHSSTCQSIQSKITTSDDNDDNTIEQQIPKKEKKGTHIFQALQYLRKLCNHPLLVLNEQHPQYKKITTNLLNSNKSIHSLHHAPKLMALKELLIECGIGIKNNQNNLSSSSNIVDMKNNSDLSPIVQHRVLIFAQLKLMLDIVESDLLKIYFPDVSYLRLDGGVHSNKRHDIVTKFNDDPTIDILLLTTHVGGLGLNLTGADTVIFIEHDWNPMKDLQAMDRAHRLGQTKVVNVYRLITRGTLEEKIMGLQKFKMNIANSVVNKENSSLRTMDTNQLLDLFDFAEDNTSSSSSTNDSDNNIDNLGNINSKKLSSTQVVEGLEELWDTDSQYTEEYNLDNFVTSLKNQ